MATPSHRLEDVEDVVAGKRKLDRDDVRCTKCPLWETSLVGATRGESGRRLVRRSGPRVGAGSVGRVMALLPFPDAGEIWNGYQATGSAARYVARAVKEAGLPAVPIRYGYWCMPPAAMDPAPELYEPCVQALRDQLQQDRTREAVVVFGERALANLYRALRLPCPVGKRKDIEDVVGDYFSVKSPSGRWLTVVPVFDIRDYLDADEQDPFAWATKHSVVNAFRLAGELGGLRLRDLVPDHPSGKVGGWRDQFHPAGDGHRLVLCRPRDVAAEHRVGAERTGRRDGRGARHRTRMGEFSHTRGHTGGVVSTGGAAAGGGSARSCSAGDDEGGSQGPSRLGGTLGHAGVVERVLRVTILRGIHDDCVIALALAVRHLGGPFPRSQERVLLTG